jgi:putative SOS response-associated peptidase YedK
LPHRLLRRERLLARHPPLPEAWPAWLGEKPAEVPQLKALLAPYPSEDMICWQVGERVGNVRNNDSSLIEPVAEA